MFARLLLVLPLLLAVSCHNSTARDLTCLDDGDCSFGKICTLQGLCVDGCRVNADCPPEMVCLAETWQCVGGGGDGDGDSDADTDADSDGDSDGDSDDPGCPTPGTVPCETLADCADDPIECACLELFDGYGGYCYPDCTDCESPFQCIEGGCLFVGNLYWEFDVQLIDPDVGGAGYIDLEFAGASLDIQFVYAYAMNDYSYDHVWILAVAQVGSDGGYVLQVGIERPSYEVGELTLYDMGTSVTITHYETWEDEHPQGVAVSVWDGETVLELTHADTAVGGHAVGTLDLSMMEYTNDY